MLKLFFVALNNYVTLMQTYMARLHLKFEKNRDFYDACEEIRRSHDGYLSTKEIAALGEASPCACFYMSTRHLKFLIWQINTDRHTPSKFAHIREKHNEIYSRYKQLLSEYSDKPLSWYADEISYQPAPRFYLDHDYATILYYKLMNNRV